MKIVKFPDPILFQKSKKVEVFDQGLADTLKEMYSTMLQSDGVGLAANQVGLDISAFVMKMLDGPLFLVNPEIIWKSKEFILVEEGCLSAPGEKLTIQDRSSVVKVKFQDEKGTVTHRLFANLRAVTASHEIDHLDGISFLQSKTLPKEVRNQLAKKWNLK